MMGRSISNLILLIATVGALALTTSHLSAQVEPETFLELPAGSATDLKQVDGQPEIIGLARDVSDSPEADLSASLDWSDGRGALLLHAPGATGLRVHLTGTTPMGTQIRLVDATGAAEPWARITTTENSSPEFWSTTVESDSAVLEVTLPEGAPPPRNLRLKTVAQELVSASELVEKNNSCQLDVTCQEAIWSARGRGVGRYTYVTGGTLRMCTGFLLEDLRRTRTPYFLTAGDCVDTQAEATSMEVILRYQSSFCNGSTPSTNAQRITGAVLLSTGNSIRHALVRLTSAPDSTISYLGWTTEFPAQGNIVYTLHHPGGALQRFSKGNVTAIDPNYWGITWSLGSVDPSSLGAPILWLNPNSNAYQVVGVITGGSASCTSPSALTSAGRFNVIYTNIRQWLSGTAPIRPLNDDFPGIHIGNQIGTVEGTTENSTLQPNEAIPGGRVSESVWYSWTAPAKGSFSVAFPCDGAATQVALYKGDSFPLSPVGETSLCKPSSPLGPGSAGFGVEAGDIIRIQVFTASLSGPSPLAYRMGYTFREHVPGCDMQIPDPPLKVPNSGADPAELGFSLPANCPWGVTTEEPWIVVLEPSSGRGSGVIKLRVAPNPGPTRSGYIYINQAGYEVLQESGLPRAACDDFGGAAGTEAGNIGNGSLTGGITDCNLGATFEREAGEPTVPGGAGYTVWYHTVAPVTGQATFSLCSFADFDPILQVLKGDDLKNLEEIALNDDHAPCLLKSQVSFYATEGERFRIRIDTAAKTQPIKTGCFTLTWRWGGPIPPPAPTVRPAVQITPTAFTANWDETPRTDAYRLDVSTTPNFATTLPGYGNLNNGTRNSRTITGLNPDSTYYYRVRAVNAAGTSPNSLVQSVTTAEAVDMGLSAQWYFAEGATVSPFQTFILMANPDSTPRRVRMELLFESMPQRTLEYDLGANSRLTVELNGLAPPSGVSTVLTEVNGLKFAAERAMYVATSSGRWAAAHAAIGIRRPVPEWFFPEGSTGTAGPAGRPFQTFILLSNPTTEPLGVDLTYYPEGRASFTETVVLNAKSRMTIEPGARHATLNSASFSTRVVSTNGVGILAERAMWWGDPDWTESGFMAGHASPGLPSLATYWYFSEGDTRATDEFILLVNPSSQTAQIEIQYLLTFDEINRELTLEPNSRRTINVSYDSNGLGPGSRHGTVIQSSHPIAVERSMYWSDGEFGWVEGTNATGAALPSYSWLLAEGATVPIAYGNLQTNILLANPSWAEGTVEVRYLLEGRAPVTRQLLLPARRSMTIDTSLIPELANAGFATEINANVPIVVERSMYFDTDQPRIVRRKGGTTSMGLPLDNAEPVIVPREPVVPEAAGQRRALLPTPTPTPAPTPLPLP